MKKFIYLALFASIIGAIISLLLLFQHFYPQSSITSFACGNGLSNPCLALSQSNYSSLFGFPIAAYGIIFYLFITFLILISDYAEEPYTHLAPVIIMPITALALIIDIALAVILFMTGNICMLCVSTYIVNIALFAIVFLWFKKIKNEKNTTYKDIIKDYFKMKDNSHWKAAVSSFILFSFLLTFSILSISFAFTTKSPSKAKGSVNVMDRYLNDFYKKPKVNLDIPDSNLILGNPNAQYTITVFIDYLCSACYRFFEIEKYLLAQFNGKINFKYYTYPLETNCNDDVKRTVYKNSCVATKAMLAAAELGVFQDYIMTHFNNYKFYKHNYSKDHAIINFEKLLKIKKNKNIRLKDFIRLLESDKIEAKIQDNLNGFKNMNISATPTLVLSGRKYVGFPPREALKGIINMELKRLNR